MFHYIRYIYISNFNVTFKNNFKRAIRRVIDTYADNVECIEEQIEYYQTNAETCLCGETKLISKLFRAEMPCSHIYHITCEIPPVPEVTLDYSKKKNKLELFFDEITINGNVLETSAEDRLRFKAVKVIRRFSHCKNEVNIRADVASITFNSEFANGKPSSYHEAVNDGITKHYTTKK